MSIASRRRALMGGGKSDILYLIENESIESNGAQIKTGVMPFVSNLNVTIVLDITTTENPTTSNSNASNAKYLVNYNPSGWEFGIGKPSQSASDLCVLWMCTWNDRVSLSGSTAAAGRKRFIVTHAANSNSVTVYHKMNNGVVYTQTLSGTFVPADYFLYLGLSGVHGLPKGTIKKAAIYSHIWSANEITAFFE